MRLQRSGDGRLVAGVCAGLGRYLDVDAWALRGLVVLFTLAQGTGPLFYLALWFVVPRGAVPGVATRPTPVSHSARALLAAAAVVFTIDAVTGLPMPAAAVQALWPAIALAVSTVLVLERHARAGRAVPVERGGPAVALASVAVLAGLAWLLDAAGVVGVHWPVVLPILAAAVTIAALSAAEVAWWPAAVKTGLTAAVAVAAVALTAVPYEGGFGARVVTPPRLGSLAPQHEVAIGVLVLDFRHASPSQLPANVTAGVGVGWLIVRLPAGWAVRVEGRVASGELELAGPVRTGMGLRTTAVVGPGPPRLTLHLSSGLGAVVVRSAGA